MPNTESLGLYMFQKPRVAKRLYFDVIPRAVDEYVLPPFVTAYERPGRRSASRGTRHSTSIPAMCLGSTCRSVSALLLNLATASNPELPRSQRFVGLHRLRARHIRNETPISHLDAAGRALCHALLPRFRGEAYDVSASTDNVERAAARKAFADRPSRDGKRSMPKEIIAEHRLTWCAISAIRASYQEEVPPAARLYLATIYPDATTRP